MKKNKTKRIRMDSDKPIIIEDEIKEAREITVTENDTKDIIVTTKKQEYLAIRAVVETLDISNNFGAVIHFTNNATLDEKIRLLVRILENGPIWHKKKWWDVMDLTYNPPYMDLDLLYDLGSIDINAITKIDHIVQLVHDGSYINDAMICYKNYQMLICILNFHKCTLDLIKHTHSSFKPLKISINKYASNASSTLVEWIVAMWIISSSIKTRPNASSTQTHFMYHKAETK